MSSQSNFFLLFSLGVNCLEKKLPKQKRESLENLTVEASIFGMQISPTHDLFGCVYRLNANSTYGVIS